MATFPTPIPKKKAAHAVHWMAMSLIIVAAVGVGIIAYRQNRQPAVNTNRQPAAIPAATTPLHYSDFVGSVESVDTEAVTVVMTTTETSGQKRQRRYRVTIDSATAMQTVTINDAGTAVAPLAVTELKRNDTIQVYDGDRNLYEVNEFTASRIIKLVSI